MAAEGGYSLSEANLKEILAEVSKRGFKGHRFDCFVETGTFLGQTVIGIAHQFQEVHTIEIRWPCFLAARLASWRARKPIVFHWGESLAVLPELLPLLTGDAVFFLDAHFSGGPTGGQERAVPLLKELELIDSLFRHAALLVIDDLDMFGKEHTFDSCDENWKFTGFCKTDWRGTDAEAILESLEPSRVACAFPVEGQNRFIVGLRPLGPRSASRSRMGRSTDWVFGHEHWRSTPGGPLDSEIVQELRGHGRGWSDVVAMIEGDFFGGRGADGKKPKPSRAKLGRAQMTKEQCEDMHDAFVTAYATPEFQAKLREAWAEAKGDKLKQLAAKQDTCFPIQMEIIPKYNFESSKKGLLDCLGVARIYYENDEVIHEKGSLLGWLVNPEWQELDPGYGRQRLNVWLRH